MKESGDDEVEQLGDKEGEGSVMVQLEQSPIASHEPVDDDITDDNTTTVTSCKPRKLPSWLLAATAAAGGAGGAGGSDRTGGRVKNKKEGKRARSPEEAPNSKVS